MPADYQQKIDELIVELRALLQSAGKEGLSLGEICRDYEDTTYRQLNPHDFGVFADRNGDENASREAKVFNLLMNKCKSGLKFNMENKKFFPKVTAATFALQGLINRTRVRKRKRHSGKPSRASRMIDCNPRNQKTKSNNYKNFKQRTTNNNQNYSNHHQQQGRTSPRRRISPYSMDQNSINQQTRKYLPNGKTFNNSTPILGSRPIAQTNAYMATPPGCDSIPSFDANYRRNNHPFSLFSNKNNNSTNNEITWHTQDPTQTLTPDQSLFKSRSVPGNLPKNDRLKIEPTETIKPPTKMVDLYIKSIRSYQMQKKLFTTDKIDQITEEMTLGKKKICDFERYGYKSAGELLASFNNIVESTCQSTSSKSFKYSENKDHRKEFISFILEHFDKKQPIQITEIKKVAKHTGLVSHLKNRLKSMNFEALIDYLKWLDFIEPGCEYNGNDDSFTIHGPKSAHNNSLNYSIHSKSSEAADLSKENDIIATVCSDVSKLKITSSPKNVKSNPNLTQNATPRPLPLKLLAESEFLIFPTNSLSSGNTNLKALALNVNYTDMVKQTEFDLQTNKIPDDGSEKYIYIYYKNQCGHRAEIVDDDIVYFIDEGIELNYQTNKSNIEKCKIPAASLENFPVCAYNLKVESPNGQEPINMTDFGFGKPYILINIRFDKEEKFSLICDGFESEVD